MANRDIKIVEQEELAVKTLLVDEIRDRKTGKLIAKDGEVEDADYNKLNVNEVTAKEKLEVGSSGALGDNLKGKVIAAVLPAFPATTDDKTYVLKLVDGELSWVEEVVENPGE